MVKTRSSKLKVAPGKRTISSKKPTKTKKRAAPQKRKKVGASQGKKPAPSSKSPKKQGKKRLAPDVELEGPTKKPPKKNWREIYDIFVDMRKDRTAPVDYFGSEALPEKGEHFEFQTLIALMLSSQTKDQMVGKVMRQLQKHGLNIRKIAKTSDAKLHKLIYGVGFHNRKVVYIKNTVNTILEKHGGQVPGNLKDLISLPGIGPKMAIIILNVAFDKQVGISVDTHLHRICREIGWTKNAKNPEDTRRQLESWLPRELWGDINLLLVGIGREVHQEKYKIIQKCHTLYKDDLPKLKKSLNLLKTLGVDVKREMEKHSRKEGE